MVAIDTTSKFYLILERDLLTASIAQNLSVEFHGSVSSQDIQFKAKNDYNSISFEIPVNGNSTDSKTILFITVGAVGAFLLIFLAVYLISLARAKRRR